MEYGSRGSANIVRSLASFGKYTGAGIAQLVVLLGSLSCLMKRPGFDPPLRRVFPAVRIFPF